MRKFFLILALVMGAVSVFAQETEGDLYHGLTKKLTFDRMIPPYGLEVTYDKTVHIIFPAAVKYVDLGSPNLRYYRKRVFLHLQCQVCRRTSDSECGDEGFHT